MSFQGYAGKEQRFWSQHHARYRGSILAVGRGNTTPSVNEREYAVAKRQFQAMVKGDLGAKLSDKSVLDCGYGQGHYARACKELGIGSYHGVDFAAVDSPSLGSSYTFAKADLSKPMDLGRQFSLVICLDVIFHIVDEDRFASAVENMRRHADGFIYVTGLFTDRVIEPYVRHRRVGRFSSLGVHLDTKAWRDNKIARFKVER